MATESNQDVQLTVTLPGELTRVIETAASHLGQTTSEFAISTLVRTAHEIIRQRDCTELSNRDRDIFLAALSNLDAEPTEALRAAAKEYKRKMS